MEDRWPLRVANLYVPGGTRDTGSLGESPDIGFSVRIVSIACEADVFKR